MDLTNPLRSVAPTVEADVLAVLAGGHAPLTGARVHQLAGRSYAQVREVLHRLVDHGLVIAEQHGNAVSYLLNRDHVLAAAVELCVTASSALERRVRELLEGWGSPPVAVVVFGSFARRDGDSASDIDLLLVHADGTATGSPEWGAQRYDLAQLVERWSGNAAQVLELSAAELGEAVARGEDLIAELRREGRVVFGPGLRSLLAAPGAKHPHDDPQS